MSAAVVGGGNGNGSGGVTARLRMKQIPTTNHLRWRTYSKLKNDLMDIQHMIAFYNQKLDLETLKHQQQKRSLMKINEKISTITPMIQDARWLPVSATAPLVKVLAPVAVKQVGTANGETKTKKKKKESRRKRRKNKKDKKKEKKVVEPKKINIEVMDDPLVTTYSIDSWRLKVLYLIACGVVSFEQEASLIGFYEKKRKKKQKKKKPPRSSIDYVLTDTGAIEDVTSTTRSADVINAELPVVKLSSRFNHNTGGSSIWVREICF